MQSDRPLPVEVHTFTLRGRACLLDVGRTRAYQSPPAVDDVLQACDGRRTRDEINARLSARHAPEALDRAWDWLEQHELLRPQPDDPAHCVPPDDPGHADGFNDPDDRDASRQWQPPASMFDLMLNVAAVCNLACRYCVVKAGRAYNAGSGLMSPEVARQAVDLALDRFGGCCRSLRLNFYGGEPLLNIPVMRRVVDYARRRLVGSGMELRLHTITNGTLLDPGTLEFLRRNRFEVTVSLDGEGEVHDAMRVFPDGTGSHDLVRRNLERLLAAPELTVNASGVVREGVRLRDTVAYLERFPVSLIKADVVRCRERPDAAFTEEFRRDLEAEAVRYAARLRAGGTPVYRAFDAQVLQLCRGGARRNFCIAAERRLGVSTDGDLYPCALFIGREEACLGHVTTGLDERARDRFLAATSWLRGADYAECRRCWARYLCAGGCPALRRLEGRDCTRNRWQIELAIMVYLEASRRPLGLVALVDPELYRDVRTAVDRPGGTAGGPDSA